MIASSDLAHVHALRDTVRPLSIPVGPVDLAGDLGLPPGARGIVVFVDGSGSSRHSPRNQFVAHELHQAGLATLLFDLLTPAEEEHDRFTGELRFNIGFLADRLGDVFEEPGTLGAVARLASAWFRHFVAGSITPDIYPGAPPPHSPQA